MPFGLVVLAGVLVFAWAASAGRYTFAGATVLGLAVFNAGIGVTYALISAVLFGGEHAYFAAAVGATAFMAGLVAFSAVLGEHATGFRRLLYAGAIVGVAAAALPLVWLMGPTTWLIWAIVALPGSLFFLSMALLNPRLRLLPGEG